MWRTSIAATALLAALAGGAQANVIPYPNPGTINPVIYSFTAKASGDITGYFTPSAGLFNGNLGLLVNGVSTGITVLDSHGSGGFDLGFAAKGASLVFVDQIIGGGFTWSSDPSSNVDGVNHVYSTYYGGGFLGTRGTYIGFEDAPTVSYYPHGKPNYFNETFVVSNVASSVPEPATWALLVIGFAGLGYAAAWRRGKAAVSAG